MISCVQYHFLPPADGLRLFKSAIALLYLLLKIDFGFSNLTVVDLGFNNETVVFTGADRLISQVV